MTVMLDGWVGKTLQNITGGKGDDELIFAFDDGSRYRMFHDQNCCERVWLEDVCGRLEDLIGSPLLQAEEASEDGPGPLSEYHDSHTWTFYKFATIKGYVTLRWYGTSNGYYSERVDIELLK